MTIYYKNKILAGKGKDGINAIGLPIGYIGQSALGIDESLGCQRYLNGQYIYQSEFSKFTEKLKQYIPYYPSLVCSEEEYETICTLSKFGQCGKFVIDDQAGTIRLPRIVNVQGTLDLTNIGTIEDESLPNVKAGVIWNGCGGSTTTTNGAWKYNVSAITSASGTGMTYGGVDFDASRCSSTYQDNAPVQEESILYPYFIQVAETIKTSIDISRELELTNPFSLFEHKWADHKLNNASWLRADTFSWQDGEIYVGAYEKLVEEYNATTSIEQTSTIDGLTFKRTSNGFKIALLSEEQKILDRYNISLIEQRDTWFYILDTTNKRFKLPRTKFGFKGLRTNVGDYIAESLPNITGTFNPYIRAAVGTGCFSTPQETAANAAQSGTVSMANTSQTVYMDASRSSSTYQDNAPVQERATQMYLYFYVGELIQNANIINAGRIEEKLNSKLDVSSSQAQAPYLKTTYVNGTSGYRIWSDGYCEQWGYSGEGTQPRTVSFIKTFSNTNYTVLFGDSNIGYDIAQSRMAKLYNKTINSITCTGVYGNGVNGDFKFYWKASGYLAEGQY